YSMTYTATLSGTQDLAGNVMTTLIWSFTTAPAPDTTPPTVVATSPLDGETGVAAQFTVTATFSESVQPNSISFVLTANDGSTLGSTFSYDDTTRTVTLTPIFPTYSPIYTVTLSGARDLAGNQMAAVMWSFTTLGTWRQTTVADFNAGTV